MAVYVDDILCLNTKGGDRALQSLQELGKRWELNILGNAANVLGMGITQTNDATYLDQTAFIQDIMSEMGEVVGTPVVNPWDGKNTPEPGEMLKNKQHEAYRNKLGKLLYLAGGTRPDIAFAVGKLASAAAGPRHADWTRLIRVLRYLKGTQFYRIRYLRACINTQINIEGYVDSSFGANQANGKSITGMIIKVAGGPVDWKSHLQETTADSTNATEYIALWEGAKAVLGVANMTQEMQLKTSLPILYEDNLGALRLATAGMGQSRARHLTCKYHAVQDWTGTKRLKIDYVPTAKQLADALTKGGHSEATQMKLTAGMGLVMAPPPQAEGPTIRGSAQGVERDRLGTGRERTKRGSDISPVSEMQADDKTDLTSTSRRKPDQRALRPDQDLGPPR